MPAKLIAWNSAEGYARLELENGQKVFVGGSYIDREVFSCFANVKSIFGLPLRRIWKFALVSALENDRNLVHLDFEDYPPFYAVVGYAMQFQSIDDMRGAQGKHASLFNAEKALDTLVDAGVLQRKPV